MVPTSMAPISACEPESELVEEPSVTATPRDEDPQAAAQTNKTSPMDVARTAGALARLIEVMVSPFKRQNKSVQAVLNPVSPTP
jgi:hypothetical protein